MASLHAQWVWIARSGALFSAVVFSGCGITFPGNLPIGDDDPGVIGQAGGGAGRGAPAGVGGGTAGRHAAAGSGATGATGAAGVAGRWVGPGGSGAVGGTWGVAGTGVAGTGWGWGGFGGVAGTGPIGVDRDLDGWDFSADCNDFDPSISPGSFDNCCDLIDNDCDGTDGPRGSACRCMSSGDTDIDGDGFSPNKGDCNELDSNVYPGNGRELCCDGVDSDCDRRDEPAGVWCDCGSDRDGDGWQTGPGGDCDDNDGTTFPGAYELCDDGIDNDCDGRYDWLDGCIPFDGDGDGYQRDVDCNDFNPNVSPGALEVCNNRVDDDCNGVIDDRGCIDDFDGDGWPNNADCDDRDPSIFPGAFEPCFDQRDSNCNGTSDFEDIVCRGSNDADGDGWTSDLDCNEMVAWINPGMMEVCGDGADNNCDGLVDPFPNCGDQQIDWDRDGYAWEKDCNDGDATVFPGSPYERCCDGLDSNCDGLEAPPGSVCDCASVGDGDGDGFGVGFSEPGRADCNDQNPAIHPAAGENCTDRIDNNCNGRIDGEDPLCQVPID